MRSRLNYFSSDKMLEKKTKLLIENPFYMVNEYINSFGIETLNQNYHNNLKNLKIDANKKNNHIICCYDNDQNILYSKNFTGDIMGLFHVSSNNRNKEGYGVVNNKEEGIGLNNGITSLFTNILTNEKLIYPIESLIAEALLLIDDKLLASSYFNNDPIQLNNYNMDVKTINNLLDKIHKNYKLLANYYRISISISLKQFSYIFSSEYKKKSNIIDNEIKQIKKELISSIYSILNNIIIIVQNTSIKETSKKEIIDMLNDDLNYIIANERMLNLNEFTNYIKTNSNTKRKILCKK